MCSSAWLTYLCCYGEPLEKSIPWNYACSHARALLELEQGHAVNNPSVLIPRWIALVQLVVIAVVAALSFTFKKRPLNIVDRIALLAFAASIFVGGDEATRQEPPLALIVGGVCVLAAWAYDRLRGRRRRGDGSSRPGHVIA